MSTGSLHYYEVSGIREILWDIEHRRREVRLADGSVMSEPATEASPGIANVRKTSFSFADNVMTLTLARGEIVTAEVDMLDRTGPQANGRLFAYLDQCQWRPIADRLHNGSPRQSMPAVDRIIDLARSNQVIFPLSAAHMVETAPTFGARRQNIAATMLEFSRGWQMRHPVAVRQDEILRHFAQKYTGRLIPQPPVFTVDPNVMYYEDHQPSADSPDTTSGLPPRLAYLTACLSKIGATYDTLMDPEPVSPETAGWTTYFQRIAQDFKDNRYPRADGRRKARALALVDVLPEVTTALQATGLDPMEWATPHMYDDIDGLPYWSLYADIVDHRLANNNTVWRDSDLHDMLFLPCATIYADAVAAEKGATAYIHRAWRQCDGKPPIFASLPELADYLEAKLTGRA